MLSTHLRMNELKVSWDDCRCPARAELWNDVALKNRVIVLPGGTLLRGVILDECSTQIGNTFAPHPVGVVLRVFVRGGATQIGHCHLPRLLERYYIRPSQ